MSEKSWLDYFTKSKALITGVVGTVSTLVGFVILYRKNPHLLLLILGILILAVTWIGCIYIVFSQTQSDIIGAKRRYKYPRARKWGFFYMATTLFFLFVIISIPSFRNFATVAVRGTATPTPSKPSIKSILIGLKDDYYKVETVVHNPLDDDLLVTHINLRATEDFLRSIACLCFGCGVYRVSDQIILSNVGEDEFDFLSEIVQEKGNFAGYSCLSHGIVNIGCGYYSFELEFDASLVIPKFSYSAFYLSIPKTFKLSEEDAHNVIIPLNRETQDSIRIYFPAYDLANSRWFLENPEDYAITTTIEVTLDSGEIISHTVYSVLE